MRLPTYIPAVSTGAMLWGAGKTHPYTNGSLTFWEKQSSMIYYPYLLMSAFYGIKDDRNRKGLRIGKDVLLIVDSGGYQKVTNACNAGNIITPESVIEYENANADIALILDVPPYNMGDGAQFGTFTNFEASMQETAHNAKIMYDKKRNDLLLYGVVQGQTEQQMQKWYDAVSKQGDFDGWALAPKPSYDLGSVFTYLSFARKVVDKPLHILQSSSMPTTSIITYFSLFYDHPITFDSSTPFHMAQNKQLALMSWDKCDIGTKTDLDVDQVDKFLCNCPVCRTVSVKNMQEHNSFAFIFVALHNLYVLTYRYNYIQSLVLNRNKVAEIIGKDVLRYFDAVDGLVKPNEKRTIESFLVQ